MKSDLLYVLVIIAAPTVASTAEVVEPPAPAEQHIPHDLEVRYARAKLELARANLVRAEQLNQRVSNAVPADVLDEYRREVTVAETRLKHAQAQGADQFSVWYAEAEAAWQSAERAWRSATAANARQPGTVSAPDVERLRLFAQVMQANVDRGAALANQPREAQLAWRLSVLSDQLAQLSEAVLHSPPVRVMRSYGDARYWEYDRWRPWR